MKVTLGTFACNGIEAHLDTDIAAAVSAALSDFTQRLESGRAPLALLKDSLGPVPAEPTTAVDLPLDERTWRLLSREARRQSATVAQLAAHSVLVYLAELDRLTPSPGSSAV